MRLAEIPFLLTERRYTQQELMEYFGVDRKTIRLDLVCNWPRPACAKLPATLPLATETFFRFLRSGRRYISPRIPYSLPMTNMKPNKTSPQRVHLHAYDRLTKLCAAIQRGRYPTKADLARVANRTPRTVQTYLQALVNDFDAPLKFDREKNGFYFTDPSWRLPPIRLSEGELLSFFIAERMLRRLSEATEVQLVRGALRNLAALKRPKRRSNK